MIHGPNSPDAPSREESERITAAAPWDSNVDYAKRVSYICCGFVILFMIFHAIRVLRELSPRLGLLLARIPGVPFVTAFVRAIGYRKINIFNRLQLSLTFVLIAGSVTIGTIVWCFTVMPLYWANGEIGSPPLAVRSGMMATAFLPFLFSMALKLNPISLLTGVSHAHLQRYHQWTAVLFFFFSIVHTVPFIKVPLDDAGYSNLRAYFTSSFQYWTGTVALLLLFWMCLSSIGFFRRMSYEFFVLQHIVCAMVTMGFLFVHYDSLISSHIWLWATVGLWIFSVAGRGLLVLFSSDFFIGPRAHVEVLAEAGVVDPLSKVKPMECVRVSFFTPLRWKPGQHVYVRFPGIAPLEAHPFTILSLPSHSGYTRSRLVLLMRVHKGITRRLFDLVSKHGEEEQALGALKHYVAAEKTDDMEKATETKSDPSVMAPKIVDAQQESRGCCCNNNLELAHDSEIANSAIVKSTSIRALLDGPYGYTTTPLTFEHVLLYASSTGITHLLPQLTMLMRKSVSGTQIITRNVKLIWGVRTLQMLEWIKPELLELLHLQSLSSLSVQIDVYVSRDSSDQLDPTLSPLVRVFVGQRSNASDLIGEAVKTASCDKVSTMAVYACGTDSLLCDISNAAAAANTRIAFGKHGSLKELRLEAEAFHF